MEGIHQLEWWQINTNPLPDLDDQWSKNTLSQKYLQLGPAHNAPSDAGSAYIQHWLWTSAAVAAGV